MIRKLEASIFTMVFFAMANAFAQETFTYENEKYKCIYQLKNGMSDGKYISYYKNGNKRSEGEISNNYRSGLWTVWDSTGRLKMQRNYKNPFFYERIFPLVPQRGPIPLLSQPVYRLKYNQDGYVENYRLRERAVVFSSFQHREIPLQGNEWLFDTAVWNKIEADFLAGKITAYKPYHARGFNLDTLKPAEYSDYWKRTPTEMTGFKISEEYIFDSDRMLGQYYIIHIAPTFKPKEPHPKGDFIPEKYWFEFSDLRKYFAQSALPQNVQTKLVRTVDDAFLFRHFYSFPYMEPDTNNYFSVNSSNEKDGRDHTELEIQLIENENDLWLDFSD